ncbi:MAG: hypothetical protein ACLUPK_05215 [Veillonella sp.]
MISGRRLAAIKAYAEGVRDGIAPTEEQQKRYMGIILKRAIEILIRC